MLGIRDVSRDLQFKSSYTVVERAPEESIELEIERHALEQIEKLQPAARDGDFTELFRLLGTPRLSARSASLFLSGPLSLLWRRWSELTRSFDQDP